MYIPAKMQDLGTSSDVRVIVMDFLRSNVTEQRTDELIALLKRTLEPRLPWFIPMGLVSLVLDYLVPDVLLNGLDDLLRKI